MSRTFRVIKSGSLVLSILLALAIPAVGLISLAFYYDGTCSGAFSFSQPCAWWQFTGIAMIYTAFFASPVLFVTLLVWLAMTILQLFVMRNKK